MCCRLILFMHQKPIKTLQFSLINELIIFFLLFSGHRLTWQAYHRLNDIYGYMDYLAETYPDLCSVQNIGKSIQGRPIKVLKVSGKKNTKRAIWVTIIQ